MSARATVRTYASLGARACAIGVVAVTIAAGAVSAGPVPEDLGGPVDRVELTHATAPARVTEDDPRWNCATMGNLRCGPGNRHPRTGQRIPAGQYERIPRALRGQRVERAGKGCGRTFKLSRNSVRHARDGSPFVHPRKGVGTS